MRPGLTIDANRWRQIETILDQALDLPSERRSTLLDEVCADDQGLRLEVEALLAADAEAGSFLVTPAGEYDTDLLADAVEEIELDLAGQQMGPYRLLREIGGGGMGTVYEAEDTRLRRRVAVKLLPPEYSRDRRAKERFLREAEAAAKVDHPNLCTVHDVGESEGRLYIVLSFYEGETLRERIRRGPLPVAEAREIAIQVARGLARAHEAGIVHRDIKPGNVILPRRGEAKILDFGIARLEGDDASLTRTGASWGTPAYMSPEQARGERVDGRTDIWSLGVMLYEMLAGRRPFGGESMEAVISAILTQEPEPLERVRPEVPPELALMVERALARHPSERYASAAELLGDLESGGMPAGLPARRRPTRVVSLAAAGALVILMLLGSALVWRPWRAAVGPPLRVAVLQPVVKSEGNDPDIAFVSSEIVEAALSTLVNLEGLQVLDPPEGNEGKGPEAERLREADEVLLPLLDCRGRSCQIIFRRRKSGGVLVATEAFEVPVGLENAYSRAQGVQVHLQKIYFDHRLRPGLPGRTVSSKDYSAYRDLERRSESGERLGDEELAQLDDLLRTSPGLVGAYLLAANITRVQGMLVRARTYSMQAQEIAPYDPEPLFTRFRVEMESRQLDAAQVVLAELAKLAPGDVRVDRGKADLLETRGELKEALRLRKEVARRRPTWRNIRELATLEFRLGESASGRQRLEALLATQPGNQSVRETQAFLEASFGDLERAAEVYEGLIRARPARSYLTNLAFVRFLLGDYAAAAAANRRALLLEPDHLLSRFNLATTLEAQGKWAEARRLYRTLEKELAAAPTPLDQHSRMLQAQCLVRLGRRDEASRLADEVLEQRPEDVQDLHQAAQLYALLGDSVSARYYVKLAREKDLRREWFMIPEFRSLQNDPEFKALLGLRSTLKAAG